MRAALLPLLLVAVLVGCAAPQAPTAQAACAKDTKICPSGDIVAREGPSCDFAQCPEKETGFCDYGSPKRDYKSRDPAQCATLRFTCGGQDAFSDECGCGCTVDYTPPSLAGSKVTND